MVTALIILLLALVVLEGLGRLVAMIAADGLGFRRDTELPRSHAPELVSHGVGSHSWPIR